MVLNQYIKMNYLKIATAALFILLSTELSAQNDPTMKTIYDFTVTDVFGTEYPLSELKGDKVMIVNTASECGLTPQYEGLQKLYAAYKNKDFIIIGFPANNFMAQEPGTNKEIAQFCQSNYGVDFPIMAKIDVIGENQHPLYQFLTQKKLNGKVDSEVQWNFQKYLISAEGELEKVIDPKTDPESQEIIDWIEAQ